MWIKGKPVEKGVGRIKGAEGSEKQKEHTHRINEAWLIGDPFLKGNGVEMYLKKRGGVEEWEEWSKGKLRS